MKQIMGISLVLLVGGMLLHSVSPTGERSNINVDSGVHAIYDLLNKYWIHSVVILYQENQVGKRAENAFRNQLQGLQKKRYLSFSFESLDTVRNQIRRILELRPEAVGFFCDPDCIAHLCNSLKNMNTGYFPYLPLTFSINDPRPVQTNLHLQDHYFVSFNGKNSPKIFRLSEGVSSLFKLEEPICIAKKVWHKTVLIYRVFGLPVFFNILFIIIVNLLLSILDTRWWHKEKFFYLLKNFYFFLLFFTNITIGLVLYIYLGERGTIRYDSFLSAIILTLVLAALLRANFFYTPGGNPIGLARYYDCFVRWFYDTHLPQYLSRQPFIKSIAKHNKVNRKKDLLELTDNIIKTIAYYNKVDRMKNILEHNYRNIPGRAERIRMRIRMEDILMNSKTLLEARKALARLLLQIPGFKKLDDLHHVPKEDGPPPRNPEEFVNKAVNCCGQNQEKKKLVEEKLKKKLAKLNSTGPGKSYESDYLIEDLKRIQKPEDSMKYKITLLFLIRGKGFLKDIGCLS